MTVNVQSTDTRPERYLNLLAVEDALCGEALDPELVTGAASGNISYLHPLDESAKTADNDRIRKFELILGSLVVATGAAGILYSLKSRKKITQ